MDEIPIPNLLRHPRISSHENRTMVNVAILRRVSKSTDLSQVAEVLTLRNDNQSEDGGIGRRAGFRFQCP